MSTSISSATARASSSTADRLRGFTSRAPDPVRWVCWLFVLNILFQRVSLPGISIPFTVPITVLWCLLAWRVGVLAIERRRLTLWLVAAGVSSAVALPQVLFVDRPMISVNSWLFWMTMWFPVIFMMADRSGDTYRRMLKSITTIGLWLSLLSIVFLASQLVVPYRDYVNDFLPAALHVEGFAISYPIVWDSPYYKSNGWIMLEPSFMAFTLGVCFMTALLSRAPVWKVLWIFAAILTTVAGSGFAIVGIGVIAMMLTGQFSLLRKYVVPGIIATAIAIPTAIGQVFLERATEVGDSQSSAAMRSFEPYVYLIPRWIDDAAMVWVGGGAGSSRVAVEGSGTIGLLAPLAAKMFYEYGMVAGALLIALAVLPFMRAHERALSVALVAQFFIIQPPAQPMLVPAFVVVALWAPAPRDYEEAGTEWVDDEPPRKPNRLRRLLRA